LGLCVGGGGVGLGLRDLALKLTGEALELLLREAQRFGVVAQDLLGGAFDAGAKVVDGRLGAVASLASLGKQTLAQHFGGDLDGFRAILLREFAETIVEVGIDETAPDEFVLKLAHGVGVVLAELSQGVVEFA